MKRRPQYQGQHDGASINRLDFTLLTQHVHAGLQVITARGLLITGDILMVFIVNFCVTCFVSRGNSIGKKLTRLNWEKAVYRPLFTLASTTRYYFGRCSSEHVHLNWINWFHFLILEGGLLIILIDCMIFLSPFLDVTRMSMSTVSFLAQLDSGILCL